MVGGYYEQYEETQDLTWWVRVSMLVAPLGTAVATYGMFKVPGAPPAMAWGFAVLTALLAWLSWALLRFTIRIGDGRLRFGFGPLAATVQIEDIEWIALERITWRQGGVGVHLSGGVVCYSARFGPGVRIHVRGRRRDWVFSADDPQRIAFALGKELLPQPPS
jgi:hypothetical protein